MKSEGRGLEIESMWMKLFICRDTIIAISNSHSRFCKKKDQKMTLAVGWLSKNDTDE